MRPVVRRGSPIPGISILAIAAPFLGGQTRDVEPGAIGRRFAETEMELLDLIEQDM